MTQTANNNTQQNVWGMHDAELDLLLHEWADEELDVPEGFHESVMMRLHAEAESIKEQTVQAPQKEGVIVSLSERFANKKAWVSIIAAATLVLCCLPVLQDWQGDMPSAGNNAGQVYEMQKRSVESDGMAEHAVKMTSLDSDTQDIATFAGTANGTMDSTAKSAEPVQASHDIARIEDYAELTLEEQLTLAQDNLAELEKDLASLKDRVENDTLREELLKKISEVKAEIKALEAQISEEEITTAE